MSASTVSFDASDLEALIRAELRRRGLRAVKVPVAAQVIDCTAEPDPEPAWCTEDAPCPWRAAHPRAVVLPALGSLAPSGHTHCPGCGRELG